MRKITLNLLFCIGLIAPSVVFSQSGYSTPKEVKERVTKIVSKYPKLAKIESLTKTPSSNDLLLVTLGSGDVANHPAVAVVAGVDARHAVGTETSIRAIEAILSRSDAEEYLAENTFYIFPCINPDATEGMFTTVKYESNRTKSLYDNDRDGLMSEDGVDDLNGDKIITAMIVETEGGEYIKHPNDSRVIVKADPTKGEKGKYKLYSEGIDNDGDGLFNEDGVDGVDMNRNFTYKFVNWKSESGNYAVSEVENRALLDFMYDAFNIHTVITLGVNDNMCEPKEYIYKTRKGVDAPKDMNAESFSFEGDNILANRVSEIYKQNDTTANATMAQPLQDGNFVEWAYYHYGRNSFATTVWSVDEEDCRESSEAAFLKWADKNNIEASIEWKEIEHPDFKDEKVEIGSLKPYAMFTPPLNLIEKQVDATIKTIEDIAALKPTLNLTTKCEEISKGVYRVTAKVVNEGEMSTATAIGEKSYFTKFVRAELKLNGQNILQGTRLTTVEAIGAGSVEEFSWLVEGSGKFEVEVGSPQSGYVSETITL